ncbi:MAG: TauD/TfdA family dioxygenase [Rhodospirillaceae bacterium]|jgi:taurine dioxygenase|nr:TauD/TfdA family dioxygenase [Rhodospirillaceae bacterium]MBT5456919.1 TauD/TfdA family dioxygenase [Rhodospirillaceae bacterium]
MSDIAVVPLSNAIGAEIRGVDLREPLTADAARTIEQAWYDHVVIVLRDQDISLDQQKVFAANFGEIAIRQRTGATAAERALGDNVMLVSNIRENGEQIGKLPDGEMMFHSDTPYFENPQKATLLYAIEVPTEGGETLFSNSYKVAESLPEDIKQRIAGRKALQIYDYNTDNVPTGNFDRSQHPHFAHPIFRKHPETGRTSLFVSELMTDEIIGLPEKESRDILKALFDHQRKEEFVYAHAWRPGDLLMWDNRCSVHARNDFPGDQRRLLRRITLYDDHPVMMGEPPYREAAAQ